MNIPDNTPITVQNCLNFLAQGWNTLNAYLDTLAPQQWTGPTDAGGWTVKDHVIHMALWSEGMLNVLNGGTARQAMDVDRETWSQGDDAINAVIQRRYKDLPLDQVRERSRAAHQAIVDRVRSMTDDDLKRPYGSYDPESNEQGPVVFWIAGNTFQHYLTHLPWIQAIAEK